MSEDATVELEIKEIRELTADDRGRVNLGKKMANQTVRIAILDDGDEDGT